MDRLKNLKKRLDAWVNRLLVELSYHYIKQLAKQTSKKRGNSLSTEFSRSRLVTEHRSTTIVTSSQDTSGKITMKPTTTAEAIVHAREWSIERVDTGNLDYLDQQAILAEFEEWIDPKDQDMEVIALEPLEEYFDD